MNNYNYVAIAGLPGLSTSIYANPHTTAGISLDPELLRRIDRMERMMENIAERLSILDDPSPERLAQHKMLKEAYLKYIFIEKLCIEEEKKNNES